MAKSIKLQTSENDGTVASKNISELDQDSKREKPVTRHQRESAITRAADERYEKIKQSEIHIADLQKLTMKDLMQLAKEENLTE